MDMQNLEQVKQNVEQDSADETNEQISTKRASQLHRNSNISSEGENTSQLRRSVVSATSTRRGISLSKSLRRRYVLALCLVLGGVMVAIVILGIVGAMSGGDEETSENESNTELSITDVTALLSYSEPPDQTIDERNATDGQMEEAVPTEAI